MLNAACSWTSKCTDQGWAKNGLVPKLAWCREKLSSQKISTHQTSILHDVILRSPISLIHQGTSAKMHLIRRSAFKALTSPSTSLLPKRSITTVSPFLIRQKPQAFASPIFRRFASDDAESSVQSDEQSSFGSSIASASESASSYASEAKDTSHESPLLVRRTGRGREIDPDQVYKPLELQPSTGIYLGNLSFDITDDMLREEFAEFGPVASVRIARDPRGYSKGFAHLEYETVEQATAAIEARDQSTFVGRRIIVNYMARSSRISREKAASKPTNTLYVGNLAFEMTDADLNELFKPIENVHDVRVAIDRRTGQPRGFAHAEFDDIESATKGLHYLSQQTLFGRKLRIDYAETRHTLAGQGQQP